MIAGKYIIKRYVVVNVSQHGIFYGEVLLAPSPSPSWRTMNWISLAQDRDRLLALICSNEPSGSIKCGEFLD